MSRGSGAPSLLLGVTSLDLPATSTRDRTLEVAGRFREPESLAVTLVKALDAGADAVYAIPSPRLRAALRELRRTVPVLVRLPLTPPSADLHHAHPLARPAARGDAGGGAGAFFAGLAACMLMPDALTGGLAARVAMRGELEAPMLGAREWAGLAVAAPITDLALAADNPRALERWLRWGRARFGGRAGFETANLGTLLDRLHQWGIEPDFVIGPVNPAGFAMKPDPATVLDRVRHPGVPVLATHVRAGGTTPLAEGAAFARARGVRGLVVDLVDLDDVAAELRALATGRTAEP